MSKRLVIEGLFEMHNIEIELENRLSNLIGENGIGKSTILKIIYDLSANNNSQLSKYVYKRIRLITDKEDRVIDFKSNRYREY